jgi:heme/copper-type cytochrome/quinol oxidase subunit 4
VLASVVSFVPYIFTGYSSQIQHSFVEKEQLFLFVFLSRNREDAWEIYKGFGKAFILIVILLTIWLKN